MEKNIVQNLGINLYLVLQKGETVVLTKEIKKSFKYKIESGGSTWSRVYYTRISIKHDRKKYKILTYTQNKTLRRITYKKEIINTTCRGMLNSCIIRSRNNLCKKQKQFCKTERRNSHNKQISRRNDQRQSQRKSDKTTSQRTKKRTLR